MLSRNADCIDTNELADYLLIRLEELIPQYNALDDNDRTKDYLNGLIAGFEGVLIQIGYPIDKLPEYEDLA